MTDIDTKELGCQRPEPSPPEATMHVTDEMVDLIREAIRFANWGAGQGLCPGAEEGISGPEDFLFEYSCKSGDEDWETLADRVSAALRAALKEGRDE